MIKKIILIIVSDNPAAINRIVAYAKAYNELGVKVILIYGVLHGNYIPITDKEICNSKGIDIISYIINNNKYHKNIAEIAKKYYENNISVIHLYGSPLLIIYFLLPKYKIFFECTEIPGYGRKISIIEKLKEFIKLQLIKRSNGVLVISKSLKQYYINHGIKNITIINMFVDISRFNIQEERNDKCQYIVYCGVINIFKDGVDILIKSFKIFNALYKNFKLLIIGDFENPITEKKIVDLIQDLKLNEFVVFLGKLPYTKIPKIISNAYMLVLSRPNNKQTQYGFPTKLGEYLATGKPVVLTKVGEVDRFLENMYSCIFSDYNNVEDFADKMKWVVENYDKAKIIGQNGKAIAIKEFSSITESKKALDFIDQTLKKI